VFFALQWLRRAPRQTLEVLAVQTGAWLAACAPVYFLHL
jgi:transcriptional regulator GlxA family with amidase domain